MKTDQKTPNRNQPHRPNETQGNAHCRTRALHRPRNTEIKEKTAKVSAMTVLRMSETQKSALAQAVTMDYLNFSFSLTPVAMS